MYRLTAAALMIFAMLFFVTACGDETDNADFDNDDAALTTENDADLLIEEIALQVGEAFADALDQQDFGPPINNEVDGPNGEFDPFASIKVLNPEEALDKYAKHATSAAAGIDGNEVDEPNGEYDPANSGKVLNWEEAVKKYFKTPPIDAADGNEVDEPNGEYDPANSGRVLNWEEAVKKYFKTPPIDAADGNEVDEPNGEYDPFNSNKVLNWEEAVKKYFKTPPIDADNNDVEGPENEIFVKFLRTNEVDPNTLDFHFLIYRKNKDKGADDAGEADGGTNDDGDDFGATGDYYYDEEINNDVPGGEIDPAIFKAFMYLVIRQKAGDDAPDGAASMPETPVNENVNNDSENSYWIDVYVYMLKNYNLGKSFPVMNAPITPDNHEAGGPLNREQLEMLRDFIIRLLKRTDTFNQTGC